MNHPAMLTRAAPSNAFARLIDVRPGEGRALAWSWAYIFSILAAYYVLRPIRDQMGVAGGIENLPWLFTATLVGHARPQPALRLAGQAHAAGAVRADHLPVLRRQHPRLRADALPRAAGLGRVDRAGVLRLAVDLQPVRGVDLLGDHRRRVLERARASACSASSRPARRSAPSRARRRPRCSPRTSRPGA